MEKIKIIILGAFGYGYEYRVVLGKALLFPTVLIVSLGVLSESDVTHPARMAIGVGQWIASTLFAVTIHRIILKGSGSVPKWGIYKFGTREFRFLIYVFGIALLMTPVALLVFIPYIGYFISVVLILYFLSRLSLVFPAIALNQSPTLADSWRATKDHKITMFLIVVIFPLVISIPEVLLGFIPYISVFVSLVSCFTAIFVIAALSVAYKIILHDLSTENSLDST